MYLLMLATILAKMKTTRMALMLALGMKAKPMHERPRRVWLRTKLFTRPQLFAIRIMPTATPNPDVLVRKKLSMMSPLKSVELRPNA